MGVFQPRFLQELELPTYGISVATCSNSDKSKILDLVDTASTMIDEFCGRTDGDGNGSLAFTTYKERLYDQSDGRGIYYLPKRPLAAIPSQVAQTLSGLDVAASGYYYTGFTPNTVTRPDGTLSCIVGLSGRYVPGRKDKRSTTFGFSYGYNTSYEDNPFELGEMYGGIPTFQPIDFSYVDYDESTGELWVGRNALSSSYSEIVVVYNSGYDPRMYPNQLKRACALIVKNMMPRNGVTGMTSFSSARSGANAQFTSDVIDDNIKRILQSLVSVRIS